MNESHDPPHDESRDAEPPRGVAERLGRAAFLVAAGVLLSVMVSCACNPAR